MRTLCRGCWCSGAHAGPQADTNSAATSAQVLAFLDNIKQQYGLKHVFAWHATMGYWSGVSPAAAAVDAAAAAQAQTVGADAATAEARAAAGATLMLPRVGPVMSDLEPPTDWSQLVSTARSSQHTISAGAVQSCPMCLANRAASCCMRHGLTQQCAYAPSYAGIQQEHLLLRSVPGTKYLQCFCFMAMLCAGAGRYWHTSGS
jgi:hypothetical protein